MEENAPNFVHSRSRAVLLIVLICHATIHHDAESEEVAIAAEEQINIDARHVVPQELVDDQVQELEALEDKEILHFATSANEPGVVDETANHELCHDYDLETDPAFLPNASE